MHLLSSGCGNPPARNRRTCRVRRTLQKQRDISSPLISTALVSLCICPQNIQLNSRGELDFLVRPTQLTYEFPELTLDKLVLFGGNGVWILRKDLAHPRIPESNTIRCKLTQCCECPLVKRQVQVHPQESTPLVFHELMHECVEEFGSHGLGTVISRSAPPTLRFYLSF